MHLKNACLNGHLDMAQWLYKIKPEINISAEDDYAFINACAYGKLDVVQWLCQIKPDISISACNDEAFRNACSNRHLDMGKWFCNLLPSKYHIKILDDCIIDHHIKKIIKIDQTTNICINELTKCPMCLCLAKNNSYLS